MVMSHRGLRARPQSALDPEVVHGEKLRGVLGHFDAGDGTLRFCFCQLDS